MKNSKFVRSAESPTILLVEDNPVERQLVSKILRDADFEVTAVSRGDVVLDAVKSSQLDLILLDAILPDIDGFEVCQLLRAHPRGRYIPIIMLTGLNDVASINRAYEVGATDFFTKPIHHTLLVHRIRYSLRTRKLMDQLRVSRQSLVNAQQAAKLGHWEIDLKSGRVQMSEAMVRLYKLEGRVNEGKQYDSSILLTRCHCDDRQAFEESIQASISEKKNNHVEHRVVFDDNQVMYLEVHTAIMCDEAGESRLLGTSVDVTDRKNSEREILRLAYCDRLTGLPNRSLLELHVDNLIPRAHVNGYAVAVLSIDLDLFNRVNNSMGYGAGDAVLQQLSERLQYLLECTDTAQYIDCLSLKNTESLAEINSDMVARLGADTFVVALGLVERKSVQARQFAEQVKGIFTQPFVYRAQELFVTASIGLAYSDSGSMTAQSVLEHADLALHEAKMQGRNEIREYTGELVAKVSAHLSIQSDLRKALNNGEFVLYYQPKVYTDSGEVAGFEALVRWCHPLKGMVSPAQFITIAEETGQIVEIGQWVLETACQQNRLWIQQQLANVPVAVNVSARQFKEGNLIEVVESAVAHSGLSEGNLELEITEGVIMSDPNAEHIVAALRERGVSISLDDFGTGYSSLSYITRFPIDTIKIDRCFVHNIAADSDKAAIVSAVSELSHGLNFNVIAEGVETAEELDVVKQLHCDEVQGYWVCPPMTGADTSNWLRERHHYNQALGYSA